jgi:hypothetical protein
MIVLRQLNLLRQMEQVDRELYRPALELDLESSSSDSADDGDDSESSSDSSSDSDDEMLLKKQLRVPVEFVGFVEFCAENSCLPIRQGCASNAVLSLISPTRRELEKLDY